MNGDVIENLEPSCQRYQLTDQLAWHELSVTYRARDLQTGTWVAFRRLRPGVALGSSEMRRFECEFELLSSLQHPAVIRAYDYGWDDQGPYYTTEYVEGRELIATAPVHWRAACANLSRIASALALLHTRGVLHGRLSPSRVLVTVGSGWKLSELSSALPIGATAPVFGAYSAPETTTACLDARADVYSLGALAFFVLTGEHVTGHHAGPPAAVSSVVRDVPPALDGLIRAMVHGNRDVRPANMAEVIARLGAIAQLEAEPSAIASQTARSYLANPPLQGQSRALAKLTAALSAAESGRGSAVQVVGEGARRLIDEACRRAHLAAWEVVRLGAQQPAARESPHDSVVRRAALETSALHAPERLFARLEAREARPLLIVLENLERCPVEQLQLYQQLVAKAATSHALLLMRSRAPSELDCPAALRALEASVAKVDVEPLSREQSSALVQRVFGDVPRAELATRWLHDASGANAARLVALARELVEQGYAQLRDGTWSLPTRRPVAGARSAARSGIRLPEGSLREAATAVALLRAPITLARARSLLGQLHPEQPQRDALGELLASQLLVEERGSLRFASLSLRDALRGEPRQVLRGLHIRLAEAWLASAASSSCRVEAAFHLLEAGDGERGALLLARTAASEPLLHASRTGAPFGEVFEAALRSCPARAPAVRFALLAGLASAGIYEDTRWYRAYADEALLAAERITGLGVAERVRVWVGSSLAMPISSFVAMLRFWLTPRRNRTASFVDTYSLALTTVVTLLGAAACCLDVERAQRIARAVAPLSMVRERGSVRALLRLCEGLLLLPTDSPARAMAALQDVRATLGSGRRMGAFSVAQRVNMTALCNVACGLLAVHGTQLTLAEDCAQALASSRLPAYMSIAALIRQLAHAQRGDHLRAEAMRQKLEREQPEPGSSWLRMPWVPGSQALPALSAGDFAQLRACAHSLESLAHEQPSLIGYQRLVSKAALVVEAELTDTLSDREQVLRMISASQNEAPVFEQRALIGSARVQASLASLQNLAGCHREAAQTCARVLARMEPGDEQFTALFLELELQHALAQSGMGDEHEARAELDRVLARVQDCNHPLVLARVHEVRAQVALAWSRGAAFQRELALAERWYRDIANTSSLARIHQLATRAHAARHELAALPAPPPTPARMRA